MLYRQAQKRAPRKWSSKTMLDKNRVRTYGFRSEGVPSVVKGSVAEISGEFGISGDILHDSKLEESNEGNDLSESSGRDGIRSEKGGGTIGEGVESVSGKVDGSRKVDSGTGDELANESQHTDASVLEFDVSETVELFLVTILNESQRIVESKGLLGSKLVLEGVERGGGGCLLGRGESRSGSDKGGEDSSLHREIISDSY